MMAICKHRVADKCKKDGRPCFFSEECFQPEEAKPMTNADHIRSMSDEELASYVICPTEKRCEFCCEPNCNDCVLEWLKQPYKENK